MRIDYDELRKLAETATPGPRQWKVNRKYREVILMGGVPKYDLTILSFARWGMSGATVCFLQNPTPYFNNLITKAQDMAVPHTGREHHSEWYANIDNPDAQFIARTDPSTILALLEERDRLHSALRSIIDRLLVRGGGITTCAFCFTGNTNPNDIRHREDCPIPAASAALCGGSLNATDVG